MQTEQTNEVKEPIPVNVSKELMKDPEFRKQPMNQASLRTALDSKKTNESKTEKKEVASDTTEKADSKEAKTDEDDETDVEDEDSTEDAETPKRSKGLERKLKKLTARAAKAEELESQLAELRNEIAEMKSGKPSADKKTAQKDDGFKFDEPEPKIDDFDTLAEHNKAVAEWIYRKNRAHDRYEAQVNEGKQSVEKRARDFLASGKELEKELNLEAGEWSALVQGDELWTSDPAAEALFDLGKIGARIAYDIANDDETRDKFNKMSPAQQVRYIGRLEAKFDKEESDSKSKGGNSLAISKAKPPGKPLKGSGGGPKASGTQPVTALAGKTFKSQAEYRQYREQLKTKK